MKINLWFRLFDGDLIHINRDKPYIRRLEFEGSRQLMKHLAAIVMVITGLGFAQDEPIPTSKEDREPVRFSKEMRGTFNGKKMPYLASHYETILYEKDDYNEPLASIFVTEYRSVKNDPSRPVIFIFNGGPTWGSWVRKW